MMVDALELKLGKCCACGGEDGVRNIVMLPVKVPEGEKGWGCFVCDLEARGAVAVICDRCLATGQEIQYAMLDEVRRVRVSSLTEPHEHDPVKHEIHKLMCERGVEKDTSITLADTAYHPKD